MFNSISKNEVAPKGKRTYPQSRALFDSHFEIGDKAKIQPKYECVTHFMYPAKKPVPNNYKPEYVNASHWDISDKSKVQPQEVRDHFKTETKNQFQQPRNPEKVKPVRDKTALFQSQYSFGHEKTEYVTTTNSYYYDKTGMKVPDIATKETPKWDIIINSKVPIERVEKASNFDFYNPNRDKKRTSNNITDYPIPGTRLDPITRRVLPTSYMMYEDNFTGLKK
jgi:hypothetical protein